MSAMNVIRSVRFVDDESLLLTPIHGVYGWCQGSGLARTAGGLPSSSSLA